MKLHISPSDLAQLSDEQKERLREWWVPQEGDIFVKDGFEYKEVIKEIRELNKPDFPVNMGEAANYGKGEAELWCAVKKMKQYALPLLSIGQMIKLLNTMATFPEIVPYENSDVAVYLGQGGMIRAELADALFAAVKVVL